VVGIAESIAQARRAGSVLGADDVAVPDDQAYAVQREVRRLLYAQGSIIGFKLGYTSQVMRAAMGIAHPNHGPLIEGMVVQSPARVHGLMQPKVEPEFAIVIGNGGGITSIRASLEVVDSVWRGYQFSWAHNTADGSSAAFAVIGDEISIDASLTDLTIDVTSSSGEVSAVCAADSGIDIEGSLQWLANSSEIPRELQPKDIVLTGGLAAPIDLPDGGWIEATFRSSSWVTRVRVERDEHR
jgi:2-keto-4-pentenoate hydratase